MDHEADPTAEKPERRQVVYQQRHREQGLCILCPNQAAPFQLCEEHRKKDKDRRDKRRAASGLEPRIRCSNCNQLGHNKRSCTLLTGKPLATRPRTNRAQYACPVCKQKGHSVRTCPQGKEAYQRLKDLQASQEPRTPTPEPRVPSGALTKAMALMKELERMRDNMPEALLPGTEQLVLQAATIGHARAKAILVELKRYQEQGVLVAADIQQARAAVEALARNQRSLLKRTVH